MSVISETKGNFVKIIEYLDRYEGEIASAEPLFQLVGKKLEEANRNLPGHLARFKQLRDEVKSLEDWLTDVHLAKESSKFYRQYNEKYPRALNQRDIQAYIDGEEDIVAIKEIVLEVKFVRQKLDSIVEAFEQMGWSLKNITELRINEMQDTIL